MSGVHLWWAGRGYKGRCRLPRRSCRRTETFPNVQLRVQQRPPPPSTPTTVHDQLRTTVPGLQIDRRERSWIAKLFRATKLAYRVNMFSIAPAPEWCLLHTILGGW